MNIKPNDVRGIEKEAFGKTCILTLEHTCLDLILLLQLLEMIAFTIALVLTAAIFDCSRTSIDYSTVRQSTSVNIKNQLSSFGALFGWAMKINSCCVSMFLPQNCIILGKC
jgi:hypothetical protein